MSTPGAVRIEDKRIGKSLYLYTRYDGQVRGPVGLGEFLKGYLPCIVEEYDDCIDAAKIANRLMGLSQMYREGEELEIMLPENDENWRYGCYNYIIRIETKKFKKWEYPVVTLISCDADDEDEYEDDEDEEDGDFGRKKNQVLYRWEGGEE